jgi:hypothetical protein
MAWGLRTWIGLGALLLVNVGVLSFREPLGSTDQTESRAPHRYATSEVTQRQSAMTASGAAMSAAPLPPRMVGATYQQVTLVGDSVLLGASPYLLRHLPTARVDAKVGRQGSDGLRLVQNLRQTSELGDAAVIHLGTNGYLGEKQFRALLEQLSDRKTVVVLNVYGARRWIGPNNDMIARVSKSFDNVRMVDWHAIGQSNPAYFVRDGIHLSGSGIHAYYNQIRIALGQPEVALPGPSIQAAKRPQLALPKPAPAATPTERPTAPSAPPQSGTSSPLPDKTAGKPLPAPTPTTPTED